MSEALRIADLPLEAVALIKGGDASPKEQATGIPIENTSPAGAPESQEPNLPQKSDSNVSRKQKTTREQENTEVPVRTGLVSLSVRVCSEIPDALVRAAADRKIKRQRPFTHQDIVVEALTVWLKKNGYWM